jgi:serine protease AprX
VDEVQGITEKVVGLILFGKGDRQRFVQETPILPDVWERFADRPAERLDLLIQPLANCSAIKVMREIKADLKGRIEGSGLDGERVIGELAEAELAPLQNYVAARLTFHEMLAVVLPRTQWTADARVRFDGKDDRPPFDPGEAFDQVRDAALGCPPKAALPMRGQLLDVARILTLIAAIEVSQDPGLGLIDSADELGKLRDRIVEGIAALIKRLRALGEPEALIARVTGNRPVRQATLASRATVKADAAFRLFEVRCNDISWAVIDSGIDRDHPAFKRRDPQPGESDSRVVRSYELGILRQLLNAAYEEMPEANPMLKRCARNAGLDAEAALKHLENAYQSYGTEILDWSSIEPLLRLAEPSVPSDGHGTHVAGIIGADWTNEKTGKPIVRGLCPDIQLIDLRIIGQDLDETEFAVLGALQLVRYLNSQNRYIVVHGVNLSLAIPHKVGSFACGRTPVCIECERLVGAGTTVVAAAGNAGYHEFQTGADPYHGYAQVSITDPGNADGVITVGATHKNEPHAYGISYFSSRGPTADGRSKPDLVAPGERIVSTLPDREHGPLDGTSQAAPHVSAAAAMLMARYPELNREPRRIKQILCESATDLGRERIFQGHGLLDILRALQAF